MGVFDFATDFLFGDTPELEGSSGFFGSGDQLTELGTLYADYLLDLIRTPIEDSPEFKRGRQVFRDASEVFGKTQRQRLGDRATTSGFLDSGAITEGELAISRQEMEAFTKGINELYFGLSDRRSNAILPFLQGAVSEDLQIDLANFGAQGNRDQLGFNLFDIGSSFIPGVPGSANNPIAPPGF